MHGDETTTEAMKAAEAKWIEIARAAKAKVAQENKGLVITTTIKDNYNVI